MIPGCGANERGEVPSAGTNRPQAGTCDNHGPHEPVQHAPCYQYACVVQLVGDTGLRSRTVWVRIPPQAPVSCQPSHLGRASASHADLGGFDPHGWYQSCLLCHLGMATARHAVIGGFDPHSRYQFWVSSSEAEHRCYVPRDGISKFSSPTIFASVGQLEESMA